MTMLGPFVFSLMGGHLTLYATVLSIFAGSLAAGLAGFACSAIAGAMLLHWLHSIDAAPLLLACSITTQLFSMSMLRRSMACRPSFGGIPFGARLLESPHACAIAFGLFLICYSSYVLLGRGVTYKASGRLARIIGGLAGDITGGTAAFAGAFPTIWCIVRRLSKLQQRGFMQPFILLMRIAALTYFCKLGILPAATLTTYLWCVPAVLAGTGLGLYLFDRVITKGSGKSCCCFFCYPA